MPLLVQCGIAFCCPSPVVDRYSRLLARLAVAKERSGWMSLLVLERTVIRSCSVN
jgi:hypothetical protein